MGIITYGFNVSIDGFIEGPDGSFDWSMPDEELHRHFNERERATGLHLYGRRLWETMEVWNTLDQDPMKKVTLRQEIEAMNLYLTTEKLRFGERLRLEFAIEERALEALVPSLLLQPLIENAVKYAVSPSEQGGTIRVEGRARGAMLELVVADDGPGLNTGAAPGAGRGVGLRNTRERLAVLYEDNHRFAALDNKPGMRIELGLPLEMSVA